MQKSLFIILIISLIGIKDLWAQSVPKDLVFQIEVVTNKQNSSISLKWNILPNVTGYTILRKKRADKNFNVIATKTNLQDTTYTDNTVNVGQTYEYAVQASNNYSITGYVYAGIEIAPRHQAGRVLLLIDSTYTIPAEQELEVYIKDLIKEGWKVNKEIISRNKSVSGVKQIIDNVKQQYPDLSGIIILGHIAVPYSGSSAPDAHSDHIGAWPSDMYYGDMCTSGNSIWADSAVNISIASQIRNYNLVGDGKFDVTKLIYSPADKIFVGRVDVYNMPAIDSNDVNLFIQYLNKNHKYRSGEKKFTKQGLIDDNFGWLQGEAFAQNGWRNLTALVGKDNIHEVDWVNGAKQDSYLWSYACGPGWYTGASGLGTVNSFKSSEIESVFSMMYGSYFGDWDTKNNFLRAPIASPSAPLVTCWVGRPNWFLHPMALGEPIGYSSLTSINNQNSYYPQGFFYGQVHQALMGDPSLKMHVYDAPQNLTAFINTETEVIVNWAASQEPNVLGYYVYRAENMDAEFQLLTPEYITDLQFIDDAPSLKKNLNMDAVYMVRAVKLEDATTGSFYNLSPGNLAKVQDPITLPATVTAFSGKELASDKNELNWVVESEENVAHYEIERSGNNVEFESIIQTNVDPGNGQEKRYHALDTDPKTDNFYRLKIVDVDGHYTYHPTVVRIQNIREVEEVLLYPNPASQTVNVMLTNSSMSERFITYRVFDTYGRVLVNKGELHSGTEKIVNVDVSHLATGSYYLWINDEEHLAVTKKFTVFR